MIRPVDLGTFYEGQNAFDRGEGQACCPHAHDCKRDVWLQGWHEAKRYAIVAKIIDDARCDLRQLSQPRLEVGQR